MERVLIVAKTRMKSGICVSGLTRNGSRGVRLIPPGRLNQPIDTDFEVGQVWDLEFYDAPNRIPPHFEDVIVTKEKYIDKISDIHEKLMQRIKPWEGELREIFDGKLTFSGTTGYLARRVDLPTCSTGYWLPDRELALVMRYDKAYYRFYDPIESRDTLLPFVGFERPIPCIFANTLVRVSLTRWWAPDGTNEERCYLQLSGWYD